VAVEAAAVLVVVAAEAALVGVAAAVEAVAAGEVEAAGSKRIPFTGIMYIAPALNTAYDTPGIKEDR
jgi:hypothetical protein